MNNAVIRDQRGILDFVNSLETFMSESQRLCNMMKDLIETSRQSWKDDTAAAFQKSFDEVVSAVQDINPELKRRADNLEDQARLIGSYAE